MARSHPVLLPGAGLLAALAVLTPARPAEPPAPTHSVPFLEKEWAQPTVREEQTRNWLERQVIPYLEQRGEAPLPAAVPLAVEDKVLFRSNWGVHAVNLRSGKLEWESDSRWSVDRMLRDPSKTGAVTYWLNSYLNAKHPGAVLENSTVATLSTDGRRLFAVEDLQVAPFRAQNPNQPQPDGTGTNYGPGLSDAVLHSRLQAFDLVTGKLVWELGGRSGRVPAPGQGDEGPPGGDADDLSDSFFLAAPLVLDGKLYVLNEKEGNLRLACLEPAHGKVEWLQPLASVRNRLSGDPQRRMRAAALAYADGVLICPTNAGFLLAFDLPTRTLLWAHDYREPAPPRPNPAGRRLTAMLPSAPPPTFAWKFCPPLIQGGKVVFTPLDGHNVLCLGLRDGVPFWEAGAAPDDLYLAGVFPGHGKDDQGKVVIAGKKACRALGLEDGRTAWTLETGLPSGRGAADGPLYYLPLKEAARGGGPEVCVLDVDRGRITAHARSRKHEVPGNLVFHQGMVLSQTAEEVDAFPQVRAKLEQIDGRIKKDPHDPRGLAERAELRLTDGDRAGAIADLHAALENDPPADVREKARTTLYEALTDLLQHDFAAGEKYLDEYDKVCRVDVPEDAAPAERRQKQAEGQRRRALSFFLIARGRERQGRRPAALQAYLDFLAAPGREEPFNPPDDEAVRTRRDAWVGGHVIALLAAAPAEERRQLEAELDRKWQAVRDGGDRDALRTFASLLGPTPAGQEARRLLAERLQKENNFLEAELVLLQIRDQAATPEETARALEALARLYTGKGLLEDAAYCYRRLGREFARTALRDGKTGADVSREAAADKRLLPYLDEPDPVAPGHVKVNAGFGNFPQAHPFFTLTPEGDEVLPFFRRHRLGLELNSNRLKVLDRVTQAERWSADLTPTTFPNLVNAGNPQGVPRVRYQVRGHLVVVNLGHMVFGLDPVDRRVLWETSLLAPVESLAIANTVLDPQDGRVDIVYQDGWVQRLGDLAFLDSRAVCVQTRRGLVALDPLTGGVVWSRADVPMRSGYFAGRGGLYVVESDAEGRPAGSRALRGADGVAEPVPDFASLYAGRLGVLGQHLLLARTDPDGNLVLRLYDVPAGKDAWEKKFPAHSRALRSEDPALTGAVDPDGRVIVLDAATGRELLRAALKAGDLARDVEVRLLQDRSGFYLVCSRPVNPPAAPVLPQGVAFTAAAPGSGLRTVPANGKVYAFDRDTGQERWEARLSQQLLFVDDFAELPVLLFANYSPRAAGGNQFVVTAMAVTAISKRTGKLLYDEPDLLNAQPFYTLRRTEAGTIELVSATYRLALSPER